MGAGLGIAQGVGRVKPDTKCFAFVGDSTFFASAITGVVNAVYNQADMTLVVLDNSTTAMTGHQPHPGTGHTMMGEFTDKIDIENILRGIGVETVVKQDPFKLDEAVETVKKVADEPGVKAIIFEAPCAVLFKPETPYEVDLDKCVDCKMCIREIGCPGVVLKDGHVAVDPALCNGCGLCSQICPCSAIGKAVKG
jgi:indolepyruvate ferredoxin oxidoreductase alpha subunit